MVLGWGLRFCTCNTLPDSAGTGGPWATHWVAKAAGHEGEGDLGKKCSWEGKPSGRDRLRGDRSTVGHVGNVLFPTALNPEKNSPN